MTHDPSRKPAAPILPINYAKRNAACVLDEAMAQAQYLESVVVIKRFKDGSYDADWSKQSSEVLTASAFTLNEMLKEHWNRKG